MDAPEPNLPCSIPTFYDRHSLGPIPGVFCDGIYMVVPRGGDISRFCYCCGQPSAGKPITKFLRSERQSTGAHKAARHSSPLLIYILVLIVGTLSILQHLNADAQPRKKRKLTFGYCRAHRRRRMVRKCLGLLAIAVGFGMFFAGMALNIDPHQWLSAFTAGGAILGATLIIIGVFVQLSMPGPGLVKEGPEDLWIAGAGKMLVNAQPPLPTK